MFILQKESYCSIKKKEKKMIGHHTRLRENDDLSLWRAPAIKKKPPFFLMCALTTHCLVTMRNAILKNDLKISRTAQQTDERRLEEGLSCKLKYWANFYKIITIFC